jgi:hypothetical protein
MNKYEIDFIIRFCLFAFSVEVLGLFILFKIMGVK